MKNETEKIKLIDEEEININENSYNNKNYMNDISFQKNKLNIEEIKKAKENGFILIGKTGTGKTSLLNINRNRKNIFIKYNLWRKYWKSRI